MACNCAATRSTRHRGSSLIEVMLAVALMAVTALGLIAGQLWTAREARAMAMREHAAWIADSVAEAMREPSAGDSAIRQWSARATALLPHGEASVGVSGGVSAARVTWTALRDTPRTDDVIDKPESCGGADVPPGSSCVVLAFAK
ncbi:prepilin-type N-terminal cleavage/methylation domain-containing protein [Paraburkholderia sediminicola]|uniref:type IV pilus modification PilV family protein n=2 Tax=Paraburkholderia sediminicola TaxID=458836 RepID=UPI0038BE1C26